MTASEARTDAKTRDPQTTAADQFAWDPNPVVVVSRRSRILPFPTAVLLGRGTPEAIARYKRPPDPEKPGAQREETEMLLCIGVTFVGTLTSAWHYRAHDQRSPPRGEPPDDARVLVEPAGRAQRAIDTADRRDPATGRRLPHAVRDAWLRVLDYLRDDDPRGDGTGRLFLAEDGFDAPDVMVLPIREVLEQATEAGRLAYPVVLAAADRCKDMTHLGALHDYAVRSPAASAIRDACRRRAVAAGVR